MFEHTFKWNEKWRIMKNVGVITMAFMLHFTAYAGTSNLQSSINAEAGLGTASLAAVYAGVVLSNIFLPAAVIKWLGTKWAVCLSLITYMPFIACQIYPSFYTLVPAGLLLGLGAGPLWCAKCTYLSLYAETHSSLFQIPAGILLQRFLGFFFMILQMSQIFGNLISSVVLSTGNTASVTSINASMIPQICGANFLPDADAAKALPTQPTEKIFMITSVYLACMAGAALIVACFLDSQKSNESCRKGASTKLSGFALLAVTLKHLKEPNQLLILTINVYNGLNLAFFGADFTASFVSCAVGTGFVGYVMMLFGLSNAVCCFMTGYLIKLFGRLPLMLSAMLVHGGIYLTMLLWQPHAGDYYKMFIISALWGFCDSVWTVQINAYYGVLFCGKEEAAFANFRLWEACGFTTRVADYSSVLT
ncbi:unnamed protein product [Arctia plantaginis]|uniref:UNC93-like protein n=1 Tax=Arctia plantaginis TaxID=874455 RepID=A0A8S1BWH0_ARCPL|nr:unnamed protein product [Arctia plantaginis]CAB3261659.1 unnamed protein product [Arctia plantaginis]